MPRAQNKKTNKIKTNACLLGIAKEKEVSIHFLVGNGPGYAKSTNR
jgi:hypothetical protein